MAKLDFGDPNENKGEATTLKNTESANTTSTDFQGNVAVKNGMTEAELQDPNKIQVTIANYDAPLVVLFGPPACGKTMTLIRLIRYLNKNGYAVQPVRSFRPSYDENYKKMCDNFDYMVSSSDAANSTSEINFMLVEVLKNGRSLCQILEGPGEYYFDPRNPKAPFPAYVNSIINSPNRVVWVIMIEPDKTTDKMDTAARDGYVEKISGLKKRVSKNDKFIVMYNKIDETPFISGLGEVRMGEAMKNVNYLYRGLFDLFKNTVPISSLFQPYNCDFAVFHTGDFAVAGDETKTFQEGNDLYPKRFWNILQKRIRG